MTAARGYRYRNYLRIVCDLDDETYEQVALRAQAAKTTMAEQIRLLIEWGLMAYGDEPEGGPTVSKFRSTIRR